MSDLEPQAVRHSYDGYGWQYADAGNGSFWFQNAMKKPDAEPLFAVPSEAVRPYDEQFDVQKDVEENPCGALMAIHALVKERDALREALKPFAFIDEDCPKTDQQVWEMIYADRVRDWFGFEDIAQARQIIGAKPT